ncbi:hypothetical protein DSUL_50038 [Desulfovibrionales bacterium]
MCFNELPKPYYLVKARVHQPLTIQVKVHLTHAHNRPRAQLSRPLFFQIIRPPILR